MTYTAQQLLFDVLPRVGNLPPTGLTFYGAANSVTSMIFKKLLYHQSDLLATGQLAALIPACGTNFNLPADFISPCEKPRAVSVDGLIANIGVQLTTDGLTVPNLALVQALFTPTSGALLSSIQAIVTAQVAPVMTDNVQSLVDSMLWQACGGHHHLQPEYLDDDRESYDRSWWDWYGSYDEDGHYGDRPRYMKIISTSFYMRPKSAYDVYIKGRYNQKPGSMAQPADVVPWNGMFDEVYREGIVKILSIGMAIPDTDQAFAMFIQREVDTVLFSRTALVRDHHRVGRRNFI
jgi:hypothetical protein